MSKQPEGEPFLRITVIKVEDGYVGDVATDGHFVACASCRDAAIITALRAMVSAIEKAEKMEASEDPPADVYPSLVH